MAVIDSGVSTSGKANVDSAFNLNVTLPRTPIADATSGVGFAAICGKNDDGTIVSGGRINRAYVAEGNRLAVANPVILWDDTFNSTAHNTSLYNFSATTMTAADAAGELQLNASSITTINTNCLFRTQRHFPIVGKSELRATLCGYITQVPQANQNIEFGLYNPLGGTTPGDGAYFAFNALAELRAVLNYNGTTTNSAVITPPSASVSHDWTIVVQTNTVCFYIDDVLVAKFTLLTDTPTRGQPFQMGAQPYSMALRIGGSAPALATQLRVSDLFITQLGADPTRPYADQQSGKGMVLNQGQNGGTIGSLAQNANNANPAAAVPTNTTAALGSGLGGLFQETLTLAAATDGIIQSFQNPTGGVTATPRNLYITGVTLGGIVTVALTTNPLTGTLSLCYGHTAVSLATGESGSFAAGGTTKAPRRVALAAVGVTSATAAAGSQVLGVPVSIQFRTPILVQPGEFVAIAHKKVTAAPATGAIMWTVTYDGYWE